MSEPLDRARTLLATVEHATVATVTADGRPWNSPVFFAYENGSIYWTSRHDAIHSNNVRANGHAFVVVYDSRRQDMTAAALYIDAEVLELGDEDGISAALTLIFRRRNETVPSVRSFLGASLHRVYRANALHVWTNVLHTEDEIPWDERVEIALNGNDRRPTGSTD